MINILLPAIVILTGVIAISVLLWGLRTAFRLAVNSLIGFFALWITKALLIPKLHITFWGVLITALFGIIGYLGVIIAHFL